MRSLIAAIVALGVISSTAFAQPIIDPSPNEGTDPSPFLLPSLPNDVPLLPALPLKPIYIPMFLPPNVVGPPLYRPYVFPDNNLYVYYLRYIFRLCERACGTSVGPCYDACVQERVDELNRIFR